MKRPEIPLFLLALAVLAAIVVLIAVGKPVPAVLYATLTAALGGGLGLTVPTSSVAAEVGDVVEELRDALLHLKGTAATVESSATSVHNSAVAIMSHPLAAPAGAPPAASSVGVVK